MINAGIRINGKHSYEDFNLYIKSREIGLPERKSVTATVPYMSGFYDFSAINGEPAYDARTLRYAFDILADTPEEVEQIKNDIYDWCISAVQSNLYDDDDPDYYFVASYESSEFIEDSELPEEGGEFSVTFAAQPYRYNRNTGERVI